MQFSPRAKFNTENIPLLLSQADGEIRFQNGEKPTLLYKKKNRQEMVTVEETMKKAGEIVEKLAR